MRVSSEVSPPPPVPAVVASSSDVLSLLNNIITMALSGKEVLVTEQLYKDIAPLLRDLGITAEPFRGEVPPDAIVMRRAGTFVEIVIFEAGKPTSEKPIRVPLAKFKEVLAELVSRRKERQAAAEEGRRVAYRKLVIPPELEQIINKLRQSPDESGGTDGG